MNRIKELLKEKNVTQQDLADRLGVNPSQETLERIANALEVPIWQLFVSPQELQRENHSLVCPKCGTPLELKIKE